MSRKYKLVNADDIGDDGELKVPAHFVAPHSLQLSLVMHPGGPKEVSPGHYVTLPVRYVHFKRGPRGGYYSTRDVEEAEFLRGHKQVASGGILEIKDAASVAAAAKMQSPVAVKQGGQGASGQQRLVSKEPEPQSEGAEELPALAARTP